ncbi:MAG TPA: prepilin-type N-terminal cleavage/methylation domain-containing protein, partial [Candidatus Polarisedimenticolaceae bacterium]|nr:prepilin-type N-terminal cleavage/methylation domain-containing protein [Candidatus Polarisedimenticolaceae bacterium]
MNRNHMPGTVRHAEAGMSLIELLVSVTILAIAMTVALTIYQEAQRSYRQGENIVEQQQVSRVAFDLISNELRLAGLNLYPDGDHERPDEAIEAAFERAIVLRADFDRDEGSPSTDPEQALAGGKFVTISTGNDEIHGFVLAKSLPDGTIGGPDAIAFEADVAESPRDGEVEPVTIDDLVLSGDDPPYTLYRVSLNNDPAKYGDASFVTRTVLAENIRSLRFRYFDLAGRELVAPGGAEDDASVAARAAIHRVTVELETLTRHPDPTTMTHRTWLLTGRVTPRNRGRIRL